MPSAFRPNRPKSKHSGSSFRRRSESDAKAPRGGEKRESGSRERSARDDKPRKFYTSEKRDATPRGERVERGQRSERPAYSEHVRPFKKNDAPSFKKSETNFKPRKTHNKPLRDAAPAPTPRYEPRGDAVLIWGLHAARAAWLNPQRRCLRLWLTEAGQAAFDSAIAEARDDLLLKRPDAKRVDRTELDRMIPVGSVHQGILIEASPLPEPSLRDLIAGDQPPDVLLMLDQVTDPHNVGAILRSAAAFGVGAVIMTERNAPGTTGALAKTASGALEHVPQIHVVNLARALDELREAGYWCVGLAEEGERNLSALDLTGRTVLVLGAEGEGLRQLTRKKCDELARLPTGGAIGSLNVSNAAAVGLYEVRRQKGGTFIPMRP